MPSAIVVHAPGGPEVLRLEPRELPSAPATGQVRVRHTCIGVNFIDVYHRSGLYPQAMPLVPGQEAAGTIEAVGAGVTDLRPGDRVAYVGALGAYADVRDLAADRVVVLPDAVPLSTAAALMLKGMTAHMLLHQVTRVQAGDTVLVLAAAGGVGQLLVAWASALGARVIAGVGSAEKAAIAQSRGASDVVVYGVEPLAARVRALTGGHGVDVVYDGVGQATFSASLDCARSRGLVVSFGQASGKVPTIDVAALQQRGCLYVTRPSLHVYTHTRAELVATSSALLAAIAQGILPAAIAGRYPLAEAARAHADLEARRTTGALLLEV